MACSIECYQEYMNRIEESRNPIMSKNSIIENQENDSTPKMKGKKRKATDSETVFEDIIIEN